ncbi:hypothetical protein FORC36_5263 (plasmid) [Vibrio vulnificus]|uniref:Uncharacterized protein n=1 Tax=Vibrio vulnificus TaxID=672 RepID=A0AAN1PWJ3_VIBVL|nr:hypothetical protein FORC36_5263 [Vibrio vulnificus]AXX63547.1 hypothetical protein FORC53_5208 [Vibrio vulnificus]
MKLNTLLLKEYLVPKKPNTSNDKPTPLNRRPYFSRLSIPCWVTTKPPPAFRIAAFRANSDKMYSNSNTMRNRIHLILSPSKKLFIFYSN